MSCFRRGHAQIGRVRWYDTYWPNRCLSSCAFIHKMFIFWQCSCGAKGRGGVGVACARLWIAWFEVGWVVGNCKLVLPYLLGYNGGTQFGRSFDNNFWRAALAIVGNSMPPISLFMFYIYISLFLLLFLVGKNSVIQRRRLQWRAQTGRCACGSGWTTDNGLLVNSSCHCFFPSRSLSLSLSISLSLVSSLVHSFSLSISVSLLSLQLVCVSTG